MSDYQLDDDLRDALREVTNVAMGRAADLLARLLNTYVVLPIPVVNLLERSELNMALSSVRDVSSVSIVCQGFFGARISGEALLIFNDTSFADIAALSNYSGELTPEVELELLMDIANILIGACLKGLAEQLDVAFSQGQPVLLGQHLSIDDLLRNSSSVWQQALTVEIPYRLEGHNVDCDLLLLFTEDSLKVLEDKIHYLME